MPLKSTVHNEQANSIDACAYRVYIGPSVVTLLLGLHALFYDYSIELLGQDSADSRSFM